MLFFLLKRKVTILNDITSVIHKYFMGPGMSFITYIIIHLCHSKWILKLSESESDFEWSRKVFGFIAFFYSPFKRSQKVTILLMSFITSSPSRYNG